jgi:hypothetical protein
VVAHYLPGSAAAVKLAAGGLTLAAVFVALHVLVMLGRGWWTAAQKAEPGL